MTTISNRRYPLPPTEDHPTFLRPKTANSFLLICKNASGRLIDFDHLVHGALIAFVFWAIGAAVGIVPGVSALYLGP